MMLDFNSIISDSKVRRGFTLIELLIVISVMMIAISLVGPTTIKMVDKANAQSEYITLQNQIKKLSYNAFASASQYQLTFSNAQILVTKNNKNFAQSTFQHITFSKQEISLNSKGYPAPEVLIVNLPNQQVELNLFRLVEGTSGKIDE